MEKKRDIQTVAFEELSHLGNVLDNKEVEEFKKLLPEIKDSWTKKQMFRTETEMRFSVLNDARHPTSASKYWQSVREQSTHFSNLITLSFEARRNNIKIKQLKKELEEEKDELKKELLQVDYDENVYKKTAMELTAKHRMREIEHWSRIKKELIAKDNTFDTRNPNTHQLKSYKLVYGHKKKTLTAGSSQPEVFNILGQLQTLERVDKERQLLEKEKKEQITK
jgi:hypothetical protein